MAEAPPLVHPNDLFIAIETILKSRPTIDVLEVASVQSVFYKAVQKLSLIQQLLPYPSLKQNEYYESISLRMTKLKKISLPECQEHEDILQMKHIQKARYFLQSVLEETVDELKSQGTHQFMEYIICCENAKNYDNIYLEYEFNDLNCLVQHLKQSVSFIHRSLHKILPFLSALNSPCSEQAIVKIMIQSEILKMYTVSNEQAKKDQCHYQSQGKEHLIRKYIDDLLSEEKDESLISSEIESHIVRNTLRVHKKLNRWTTRYNNEIEVLDVTLLQTKSRLDDQRDQYNKLLQIYLERKQVISTYLEITEMMDQEMDIKRSRIKAATIIQNWWRNILLQRFIHKRIVFKKLKQSKRTQIKRKIKKNKH